MSKRNLILAMLVPLLVPIARSSAQEGRVELVGQAHANGLTLFRVAYPPATEVAGVSVAVSRDGENYQEVRLVPSLSARSLKAIVRKINATPTMCIPLLGNFNKHEPKFVFDAPGRFHLKWQLYYKGGLKDQISQQVEVRPQVEDDALMLERLQNPRMLKALYGDDSFQSGSPDFAAWVMSPEGSNFRALTIVSEWLDAAPEIEPLEGRHASAEKLRSWTDWAYALSRDFPGSTYAPYSALYAGGGYVTYLCEAPECRTVRMESVRVHELYSRAVEMLDWAADRGDCFVRPLAFCQQARLMARSGEWAKAEAALNRARLESGPPGTELEIIGAMESSVARMRSRVPREDSPEQP